MTRTHCILLLTLALLIAGTLSYTRPQLEVAANPQPWKLHKRFIEHVKVTDLAGR